MVRKIFKADNSLVVSLPGKFIDLLGLQEGSELNVEVDLAGRRVLLTPVEAGRIDIDPEFALQLAEFIEQYRPALAALAR